MRARCKHWILTIANEAGGNETIVAKVMQSSSKVAVTLEGAVSLANVLGPTSVTNGLVGVLAATIPAKPPAKRTRAYSETKIVPQSNFEILSSRNFILDNAVLFCLAFG